MCAGRRSFLANTCMLFKDKSFEYVGPDSTHLVQNTHSLHNTEAKFNPSAMQITTGGCDCQCIAVLAAEAWLRPVF